MLRKNIENDLQKVLIGHEIVTSKEKVFQKLLRGRNSIDYFWIRQHPLWKARKKRKRDANIIVLWLKREMLHQQDKFGTQYITPVVISHEEQ